MPFPIPPGQKRRPGKTVKAASCSLLSLFLVFHFCLHCIHPSWSSGFVTFELSADLTTMNSKVKQQRFAVAASRLHVDRAYGSMIGTRLYSFPPQVYSIRYSCQSDLSPAGVSAFAHHYHLLSGLLLVNTVLSVQCLVKRAWFVILLSSVNEILDRDVAIRITLAANRRAEP